MNFTCNFTKNFLDPKKFSDTTLVSNIFIDPISGEVMNHVSASCSLHEHDVTGGLEVSNNCFELDTSSLYYLTT